MTSKNEELDTSEKTGKSNANTKLIKTFMIIILSVVVVSAISAYGIFYIGFRALDSVLNPSEKRVQANKERSIEIHEKLEEEVKSRHIFVIPTTQKRTLSGSGDFLLLSTEDYFTSYSNKEPIPSDLQYIPLGEPQLVEWIESETYAGKESGAIVSQIPTAFDSKVLMFEDGSYQFVVAGRGPASRVAYTKDGNQRARGESGGGIEISTGPYFETTTAFIDRFHVETLAWSENGDILYFVDSKATTAYFDGYELPAAKHIVYQVNADGSELKAIYILPAPQRERFQPKIAIIPGREELMFNVGRDLMMINPVTEEVTPLPFDQIKANFIVSPDGTKVAHKLNLSDIVVTSIPPAGSSDFQFLGKVPGSGKAGDESNFVWSSDSQKIIFEHNIPDKDCYGVYSQPGKICFYNIAVWDLNTPNELTFPLDNYAFDGRIIGLVSR